jgi:hypothetical protein
MVNSFRNIVRIKVVAKALKELNNKVVFVGGAVVDLYADDLSRGETRPTDDVDVFMEIVSRVNYVHIEKRLRKIGFKNDMESNVICRYKYHDIVVDVMPDDETVLGFANTWYKKGINSCQSMKLDDTEITILNVAYFLATKFEALGSKRHGDDYRLNSDFEDIVYIFDNRTTILQDIFSADNIVNQFLKTSIAVLLIRPNIEEEVSANLERSNQIFRKNKIMEILRNICEK